MLAALSALLCVVGVAGVDHFHGSLRSAGHHGGHSELREFKHRLRVCNAYPFAAAMDVYRGRNEKLTGEHPMPYKECRDFLAPLRSGDKLEFKVGDANAGTFAVSDLPNNDAILLLVIHRHDTVSTAVAFESHVFANLLNAQVAIIDTYKGEERAAIKILDAPPEEGDEKAPARAEQLRFNSVVAVNPGIYQVQLTGDGGEVEAATQLVALNRKSYVVLRTGVEAEEGPSFPQELVVFPKSNPDALIHHTPPPHSAAAPRSLGTALMAATVAALLAARA